MLCNNGTECKCHHLRFVNTQHKNPAQKSTHNGSNTEKQTGQKKITETEGKKEHKAKK